MAKFIVIDGLDGCGKATQVQRLAKYLKEELDYNVHIMSFPAYDSDSSALVKMYLGGEFGKDATKLNPYICSSFYAVDRFASFLKEYNKYFEEDDNTIILADRYLSANIIHQASKINNTNDRHKFIKWVYDFECGLCGLPKEDMTILLTIPPEISQSLMTKRYDGNENKKDIHENSLEYLQKCYDTLEDTVNYINYSYIAKWKWFDCSTDDKKAIKSIEEITDELITAVILQNTI